MNKNNLSNHTENIYAPNIIRIQKLCGIFVLIFGVLISLYHPISTRINFGSGRAIDASLVAMIREVSRFLFATVVALVFWKRTKVWLQNYRYHICTVIFSSVIVIAFSFFVHDASIANILIGLKSSRLPLWIFVSARCVGYCLMPTLTTQKVVHYIIRLVTFLLMGGFLWQGAKHLFPDIFSFLGFGPVGDWHYAQAPPLYYRTGPGGRARFSGLFAGPNNFGYFLIVFMPLYMYYIRSKWQSSTIHTKIILGLLCALFLGSGFLTLSRGVIVGRFVQSIFLAIPLLTTQRRQTYKRFLLVGASIVGGLLVALSLLKRGSTVERFHKRSEGRQFVRSAPFLGHGLGTSGPAVHHSGSVVPENFFLQLWIDSGIVGLLLWIYTCSLLWLKKTTQQTYTSYKKGLSNISDENKYSYFMTIGRIGLLCTGMFLHILEDSMVVYLFFVPYGLLWGTIPQKNTPETSNTQKV